jgi:TorA maturation chaperone TorD
MATPLDRPEDELAGTAMEVSHLHGLLAAVFREEITAALLEELRAPAMVASLAEAGVGIDERLAHGPAEGVIEELAVEYAALFLGPGGHVSPHESVHAADHEHGTLWSERTVAVRRFIESAGFEYHPRYRGIPDHLSVELELMAELSRREGAAWEAGDRALAARWLELQSTFLDEHLSMWIGRFSECVAEAAQLDFYRDFAALAAEFVASEREEVDRRLARAGGG